MGELVRLEVDSERRVGTIRVDRPPMNALSRQVWHELEETAGEAAEHDEVGAVVVWGGEKVFAAGADVKEFPQWSYQDVNTSSLLQRSLDAVARLPMATIAAVNGYALGGGCELALACDFRFLADNAKLGQPEILLGLIPGAGGTQRLARLVGSARAKDLIFSGRMVDAVEAPRIGLADAVHPADDVYERALEQAAEYARGPYALGLAKQAIDDGLDMSLDDGLRLERALFAGAFATDDARIGIDSFLEHGPGRARFTGN